MQSFDPQVLCSNLCGLKAPKEPETDFRHFHKALLERNRYSVREWMDVSDSLASSSELAQVLLHTSIATDHSNQPKKSTVRGRPQENVAVPKKADQKSSHRAKERSDTGSKGKPYEPNNAMFSAKTKFERLKVSDALTCESRAQHLRDAAAYSRAQLAIQNSKKDVPSTTVTVACKSGENYRNFPAQGSQRIAEVPFSNYTSWKFRDSAGKDSMSQLCVGVAMQKSCNDSSSSGEEDS